MKAAISDLIRHFDGQAPAGIEFSGAVFGQWDRDLHQQVLQYAELDPETVLLELGCGTGRFTHLVAPHIRQATAVDLSPNMLRMARERAPTHANVRWLAGDLRDLPPTDGIDTVVACHALRYLDTAEQDALFAELYRRLPIGGLLVIGDLLWSMDPDMIEGAEDWLDTRWAYTVMVDDLEARLRRAGFDTFAKRMHPALAVIRAARMPERPPR